MTTKEPEKPFQWPNAWNQYFAVLAANILQFAHGCITGWPSPALPVLTSENSPLVKPLTIEESSWIGSINCIGGLCGSLLFGYVIPILGSKRALLVLTIPSIIFWAMIYFSINFNHILIARFIAGCASGAMQSATMLYVSEIANDDIRGRLGSFWLFMRTVGVLFIFIAGAMVEYEYLPCICVLFPILFSLVFVMMPITPQYFLQKEQIQKAENALKYYKGYRESS
ncbi:solute carrier family 2, facilitated glucose transporter member 8-like [Sitodiplosis mosellana]|uniref:solute carrier family 2, facilitated glucose transporter member 8-like n=1 Tax=Sitodiplosis mosellana TaxID=263140 RepID=UPI002443C857|nr:solute carrier family 2, facilitated glucose transporter member 8-like [Sitodiplosis mosellana]